MVVLIRKVAIYNFHTLQQIIYDYQWLIYFLIWIWIILEEDFLSLPRQTQEIDIWEPINSSQLFYKNNTVDEKPVSKTANYNSTENLQHGTHEGSALKTTPKPQSRSTPINNPNSIPQDIFNI